jgi:DnaK suppressor protein
MARKIDFSFPAKVLAPVRGFLSEELKKLKKQAKKVKESDPFADSGRVNDNAAVDTDVAEQVGHSNAEARGKFIKSRIIQIRKALTRIKVGKYGICEECKQMIDTDRLTIYPETTVCVKCVKKREK